MSYRISRIQPGLTSAMSRFGAFNGVEQIASNPRITPVLPVAAIKRRQPDQKMPVRQTARERSLKKDAREKATRTSSDETSESALSVFASELAAENSSELDKSAVTMRSGVLESASDKPRSLQPVQTQKRAKQLGVPNPRKQRKSSINLGNAGHDHDMFSDTGGVPDADELTSNATPAVQGPIDAALPMSQADRPKLYAQLGSSENAGRAHIKNARREKTQSFLPR